MCVPERVMDRKTIRAFVARRETPGLAFDLANLTRNLVKGLFDTYRPELHYMRGPGPKWRAKHEGTPRPGPGVAALMPVAPGHARVLRHSSMPSLAPVARQSIGPHNFVQRGASLTLGIGLFVTALLFTSPTASKADASYCAQVSDLAATRLRWAVARQSHVDSAQDEKKCRVYRIHFYDAVTVQRIYKAGKLETTISSTCHYTEIRRQLSELCEPSQRSAWQR